MAPVRSARSSAAITTATTAPALWRRSRLLAGVADHPILKGVELPLLSNGSLYKASPLAAGTQLLLVGTIPDQPSEPVAWTNRYKNSRVFYTSLGHPG